MLRTLMPPATPTGERYESASARCSGSTASAPASAATVLATRATRARPRPESGTRSTARSSSADAASVRRQDVTVAQPLAGGDHPHAHRGRRLTGRRSQLLGPRSRHRDDEVEAVEQRARHLLAIAQRSAAGCSRSRRPDRRAHRRGTGSSSRRAGSAPGRARARRPARPRRRRPRAAVAATRAPGAGTRAARPSAARLGGRGSPHPGRGTAPPPTIAAAEAPWCGARNGGTRMIGRPAGSVPATEWMRVTSSASSRVSGGRMPGQPPAEHRLARSRRPCEQHVVLSRRGELERPAPALLAAHLGEVGQERLLELVAAGWSGERDVLLAPQVGDRLRQVVHRDRRRCPPAPPRAPTRRRR